MTGWILEGVPIIGENEKRPTLRAFRKIHTHTHQNQLHDFIKFQFKANLKTGANQIGISHTHISIRYIYRLFDFWYFSSILLLLLSFIVIDCFYCLQKLTLLWCSCSASIESHTHTRATHFYLLVSGHFYFVEEFLPCCEDILSWTELSWATFCYGQSICIVTHKHTHTQQFEVHNALPFQCTY